MAWSAKLMSGSGGTQGVNEWQMVYNPSTQTELKLKYNFSLGDDAPDVLYHKSDEGSPIPVRANDKNKLIFLNMDIPPQGGWDDVLNVLTPVSRLVDGSDSQAIRAQIDGDVDKVKVAIKPDGATYTTYYEVMDGFVDASQAFTNGPAVINKMAYGVTIALTCKPLGYGDSFTLANYLASSPHMLEDSNADGLADGLTVTGTPGTAILTSAYLFGGQSQYIEVDASTSEGIIWPTVTAAIGTQGVGYIWLSIISGDPWRLQLLDGSGNLIQEATVDGTSADKSIVSPTGHTFLRYKVSGTNSTAANFILLLYRSSASATQAGSIYVQAGYLTTGTTTAPPAFSSTRTIYNRNDPETATGYINYLDVWGIPGDAPATMRIKATASVTNAQGLFVLGRAVDGILAAGALTRRLEGEDFSADFGPTNGSGSTPSDANRHSGAYYRLTASGGVGSVLLSKTSDGSAARAIATGLRRVYAICRSSSTATRFYIQYSSESSFTTNTVVSPTAVNTWEMHDMGAMALDGKMTLAANIPDSTNEPRVNIKIGIDSVPNGGTADVDALFFLPTKEFIINSNLGVDSTDPQIWFDGHNEFVVIESTGAIIDTTLGSMWNLQPGPVMNRITMLTSATTKAHTLTDSYTLSLEVIPRTRHLLGTI